MANTNQNHSPASGSKTFLGQKRYYWAGLVVLALVGLAAFQAQNLLQKNTRKQQVLDHYQQQKQTNTTEQASDQLAQEHIDAHQEFKNLSDPSFEGPSCEQLEGRKAIVITSNSCDYRIKAVGTSTMAVVLFYHNSSDGGNFTKKKPKDTSSLYYLNTYLKKQAKRYGVDDVKVDITTFGPYQLKESTSTIKKEHHEVLEIYQEASTKNDVPEDEYDMVHYVDFDAFIGDGVAWPWTHRAFTQGPYVGTFVHETLHLFGASDKYNNNECATIGTKDPFDRYQGLGPGKDIMCLSFNLNYSNINDITAREIGWPN